MKTELIIPDHFPELKEEDLKIAAKRRENYSLIRDLQAKEFNNAIASRLSKESEKQVCKQSDNIKQVKCGKCGKEFSTEIIIEGSMDCPECAPIVEIE